MPLYTDRHFKSENELPKGEFNSCSFSHCDLSGQHLSNYSFTECEFNDCNLSNTRLKNTGLKEVLFKRCKLMGTPFFEADSFLLQLQFDHCNVNLALFQHLNLTNCSFNHCSLQEADFSEANCQGLAFLNCDLDRALFHHTKLQKVDFRTAYNFNIHPEQNQLKGARFKASQLSGLLHSYKLNIDNDL